jgi:hypothetical protein
MNSLKNIGTWNGTTDYLRITHFILKVMITLIDVGLNWSVRSLQKDIELPISPDLFHHGNVKSVFEKCRLLTYCLDSFLACSALQGMPNLSSHSWVLCKNGTRKYTNESVIPMIIVLLLCYIFTCRWTHLSHRLFTVCCVGYNILVKYWFILNPTLVIR